MLNPRLLPSYTVRANTIKLDASRIESVSLETKPILKDAPYAIEHNIRV